MISKTTLAALLTTVSVASLMIAAEPAFAGTTLTGNQGSVVLTGTTDFVVLDNNFHATGDVTNTGSIAPLVTPNFTALFVDAGAQIDGALINTELALISATAGLFSPSATATAIESTALSPKW